jgi:hypothetical protein
MLCLVLVVGVVFRQYGEKKNFSSAASAKDYLKTAYIPPLSPREQEARDKKEAEKKATEKDNDA